MFACQVPDRVSIQCHCLATGLRVGVLTLMAAPALKRALCTLTAKHFVRLGLTVGPQLPSLQYIYIYESFMSYPSSMDMEDRLGGWEVLVAERVKVEILLFASKDLHIFQDLDPLDSLQHSWHVWGWN